MQDTRDARANWKPVFDLNRGSLETIAGEVAELGARLEPLNDEYGTAICISQSTFDAVGGRNRFIARFLDLVVVKGKSAPVAVYELMGATAFVGTFAAGTAYFAWQKPSHAAGAAPPTPDWRSCRG